MNEVSCINNSFFYHAAGARGADFDSGRLQLIPVLMDITLDKSRSRFPLSMHCQSDLGTREHLLKFRDDLLIFRDAGTLFCPSPSPSPSPSFLCSSSPSFVSPPFFFWLPISTLVSV